MSLLRVPVLCSKFYVQASPHLVCIRRFSSKFSVNDDSVSDSDDDLLRGQNMPGGDTVKKLHSGSVHWKMDNSNKLKWKMSSGEGWDPFPDRQRHLGNRDWSDRFTNLHKPKWNLETAAPVQKNFYKEHPAVGERCEEEDLEYFKKHNIVTRGRNALRPVLSFDEINFPDYIINTMRHEQWTDPTPTQAMGWPLALSGRDIIGVSRTGSGKTAAFLLPGLVHTMNQKYLAHGEGPIFVCLVPTRELAQQVGHVTQTFARPLRKRTAIIYGGARKGGQLSQLQRGPELLIATPGRLLDFLEMEDTNMDRCTFLVLDEADRMLDMGFEPQIRKIINQIRPDRQTLMYTATWPEEVQDLARDFQTDPVQVNIGSTKLHANTNIEQRVEICTSEEKTNRLFELLKVISQETCNKTLIFVATKARANWLERKMKSIGWPANAIHGDKAQTHRDSILNDFRSGRVPVLIATDVASRGLDVQDIEYVINMDFPAVIEDYVHRIGRTARGEKSGTAVSIFTDDDFRLSRDLMSVLKDSKQHIPEQLQIIQHHFSSTKKRHTQHGRYSRYSSKNSMHARNRHSRNTL